MIWQPQRTYIVIGASNSPSVSLNEENVAEDGVEVQKRPSGGQAVVLTPNTLVVSVLLHRQPTAHPLDAFRTINTAIAKALEEVGIEQVEHRGISDITIKDRKILGSSIYQSKDRVLYHGVLNVSEPASTFERYLKHPPKEPGYREGRSHADFVTSLACHHQNIRIDNVVELLEIALKEKLIENKITDKAIDN